MAQSGAGRNRRRIFASPLVRDDVDNGPGEPPALSLRDRFRCGSLTPCLGSRHVTSLPDLVIRRSLLGLAEGDGAPHPWIFAPWLAALPGPARDLMALLPVADVNGLSFNHFQASVTGARIPAGHAEAIAAIFCADPFLRVRDAARALAAAGIRRVVNFPTIQVIDGTTARGFESAALGFQREADNLGRFAGEGFEVVAFAVSAEGGAALARNGAAGIVLHPGLASTDWRTRAAASHDARQALRSLRLLTDVPVRLMCPDGYGAELEPVRALADGIVRYS